MSLTLTKTPTPIVITGAPARDIASHVRTYVRPDRHWAEVQGMRECHHGCNLYVRRHGAVLTYRLVHSTSYGCALGSDPSTRVVPVHVRPAS